MELEKTEQAKEAELFVPLLFWFNKDTRPALPPKFMVYYNPHLFPELYRELFMEVTENFETDEKE